jgi:predicted ATP-binding protein involved in virulence
VHAAFEGIVLIDSPEHYLHPRWVGRIVRALRKLAPEAQFIVATHADDPWEDAMSWEPINLTY